MHIPTLNVAASAPELVLALAAVGAQYRFENSRGIELFYAAKAVVLEQVRRRDGASIPQSWNRPSSSSNSRSPGGGFQGLSHSSSPFQFVPPGEQIHVDCREHMGSIQALLLLTAFATWERHQELLREALAFQSILARLVREAGLTSPETNESQTILTWEEWVRAEGDKRTKLIVYCFFNLHSITWNVPPLILNSEIKLDLPEPANEWKATSAEQWQRLHTANATVPMSFQTKFAHLFSRSPQEQVTPGCGPVSPTRQLRPDPCLNPADLLCATACKLMARNRRIEALRSEDIAVLERGLSAWKAGWKRTPESSLDPQNPNGPVAFTSTALLGLKLHSPARGYGTIAPS